MATHVNKVVQKEAREPSQGEPELLSIEDAAARLGLSAWTVRRWICDRKITSCKLGARRLIPVAEIARLIRAGMEERDESA